MSKCASCPIDGQCRSYPALCQRHAEDPARWLKVVDLVNEPDEFSPPGEAPNAPDYPPLAKQAANALGSALRHVASGLKTVDQVEYDRRRAICQACPTGRYVEAEDRCEACGCYLAIKPWGKAERCPDGHW